MNVKSKLAISLQAAVGQVFLVPKAHCDYWCMVVSSASDKRSGFSLVYLGKGWVEPLEWAAGPETLVPTGWVLYPNAVLLPEGEKK